MSVTRPTLIFFAGAAVDVVPAAAPVVLPPSSSSLPHAATAKLPMASMRAIRIARNALRCTAPPSHLLAVPALPCAGGLRQSTEERGRRLLGASEAWTEAQAPRSSLRPRFG